MALRPEMQNGDEVGFLVCRQFGSLAYIEVLMKQNICMISVGNHIHKRSYLISSVMWAFPMMMCAEGQIESVICLWHMPQGSHWGSSFCLQRQHIQITSAQEVTISTFRMTHLTSGKLGNYSLIQCLIQEIIVFWSKISNHAFICWWLFSGALSIPWRTPNCSYLTLSKEALHSQLWPAANVVDRANLTTIN